MNAVRSYQHNAFVVGRFHSADVAFGLNNNRRTNASYFSIENNDISRVCMYIVLTKHQTNDSQMESFIRFFRSPLINLLIDCLNRQYGGQLKYE